MPTRINNPSVSPEEVLPKPLKHWFKKKKWHLHPHQEEMIKAGLKGESTLLVAPTGAGKTLSGFLPSLIELNNSPVKGLHTLYISPLKALANDIRRNLETPVSEMKLPITLAARTGDTKASERARMKKHPPNILLTTPESLALMLSYGDAAQQMATLKTINIDEIHAFMENKRGDMVALLLARLAVIAPQARRVGLSATIAHPPALAEWLARPGEQVHIITAPDRKPPEVEIYAPDEYLPIAGHFPKFAIPEIYKRIKSAKSSIVFVNTRALSELLFQHLWEENNDHLPIGLHHGSLTRDQRMKVEAMMASGEVRAVVATGSLDLGIDWGNVDLVIQVGAPKGVSRLLQRIGRSNHRFDLASRALLIPTNCFEYLECRAAVDAMQVGKLDDTAPHENGPLDVLAQHIMSYACANPIEPDTLYGEIRLAYPYRTLPRAVFDDILQYVIDGGYVLKAYDRYHRLVKNETGALVPASPRVSQRHRMNIGTIVESEKLKVMRVTSKAGGKRHKINGVYLGEVEERLIMGLNPGDSFMFAGQVLEFQRVRDMMAEVTPSTAHRPMVPSFLGGRLPLSTYLARAVRELIADSANHPEFPKPVRKWLHAQGMRSVLPSADALLVETFPHRGTHYMLAYPFAGRPAHQTLGFLLTQRMERAGLKPLGFTISDYAIAIETVFMANAQQVSALWSHELLDDELDSWLENSAMLKRAFRDTAIIAGLIERKLPGQQKNGRQVTFSTDLIYDVLKKYQADHLLLLSSKRDMMKGMLDVSRLQALLNSVKDSILHKELPRISPMSVPLIADFTTEPIKASGIEHFYDELALAQSAEELLMEASGRL